MNLVQPALRRPLTVVVAAIALALGSVLALREMPRDIFPTLGIPTIYVAQPFGGMDPAQMEGYLTYYYEYHFLYITGIEHVESKSIQGASIIKLQFYPGTDMSQAMSKTVAYVNRARAFMPPGTVPPFIMRFDAGSVPVGNLVFSSETRSVGEMQDAALNLVRPLFATLPGVSAPAPFLQHVARRNCRGHHRSEYHQSFWKHAHQTEVSDGAAQFGGEKHQGPGKCTDSHGLVSRSLPARYRRGEGRLRHHHQLRPGERQAHRLYPGHQALGRFHSFGRQSGEE